MSSVTSIDPVLRWLRGGPTPHLNARDTRVRVAELLSEGLLNDEDAPGVVMAFESVGTEGVVAALRRFVKHREDAPLREAVRIVLAARRVGAEPGRSFVDTAVDGMRSLLATAAADAGVARMLVDQGLEAGLPPPALVGMFATMMAADRLPVSAVLGAVLATPGMTAVHEEAIRRFATAASPDEAPEFHRLAGTVDAPALARLLRVTALRLGTTGIEGEGEAAHDAEAWISTCDGVGAFRVVVRAPVGAGRYTVLVAVIRAHQGIRDLFTFPCRDEDDADDLLYDLAGDGAPEVAVLPGVALTVVEGALVDGLSLEPDEEVVLASLRRVCGAPVPIEEPAPGGKFDARTLAEVITRFALNAWYFDDGDIGMPAPRRVTAAWVRDRIASLPPELVARLVALCRHMARFCMFADDPVGAGRFARAAAELGENPRHALTEHMLRAARANAPTPAARTRPEVRERIRDAGFAGIRTPRHADLARLDLSEQAELAMDRLWDRVPGERMLRERDQLRVALAIGQAASASFLARDCTPNFEAAIVAAAPELRELAHPVAKALSKFVADVCATCPAACAHRPDKAAGRLFHRERHPALES